MKTTQGSKRKTKSTVQYATVLKLQAPSIGSQPSSNPFWDTTPFVNYTAAVKTVVCAVLYCIELESFVSKKVIIAPS